MLDCHLTGSGHFGSGDNSSTEKGVTIAPTGAPSGYPDGELAVRRPFVRELPSEHPRLQLALGRILHPVTPMTRAMKVSAFVAMGLLMVRRRPQRRPTTPRDGSTDYDQDAPGSRTSRRRSSRSTRICRTACRCPNFNLFSATQQRLDFSLSGQNVRSRTSATSAG